MKTEKQDVVVVSFLIVIVLMIGMFFTYLILKNAPQPVSKTTYQVDITDSGVYLTEPNGYRYQIPESAVLPLLDEVLTRYKQDSIDAEGIVTPNDIRNPTGD